MYFPLCSWFTLLPGLNKASISNSVEAGKELLNHNLKHVRKPTEHLLKFFLYHHDCHHYFYYHNDENHDD